MGVPQLNSCCCGCTLKTGTKIIGWLCLICFILTVVMAAMGLAAFYYLEEHPPKTDDPAAKAVIEYLPVLKALSMFFIAIYSVGVALSVILLMGVYQEKAKLVFIWVVVMTAAVVLSLVLHFVEIIYLPLRANPFEIISLLLDIYFILVVYSYYREIQNVSNYA